MFNFCQTALLAFLALAGGLATIAYGGEDNQSAGYLLFSIGAIAIAAYVIANVVDRLLTMRSRRRQRLATARDQ